MMAPVLRIEDEGADPESGSVKPDWAKIVWFGPMIIASFCVAPFYFNWPAFALFLGISYITLLLGHSVGMHRMMIHRSFMARPWLKRGLIYLGVLVGMSGPLSVIRIHDMRDWAQRQPDCHDFFSHKRGYFRDVTWQLFYRFDFEHPPMVRFERELILDPWIMFMERTWRWHQLALAAILFWWGGLPLMIWGVCVRVSLSVIGHWTVTYICHNPGPGTWHVEGAGVQASNFKAPLAGFLTHGECWHNNHHAFPESARIGLEPGQIDPAWKVICGFEKLGWVSGVGHPRDHALRDDLQVLF